MKMGIHKNTLGYTRMPIKIGIQLARLAEIHQLQDENGHREGRNKQSRPDSSIQPVTQPRTQRDTERSPTAFTHFPTCIIALCDIPPHAFLRYTCRLCEGLGATRRAAPYTLHTHYIHITYTLHYICRPAIFADLRRTRCQTGVKRAASIH